MNIPTSDCPVPLDQRPMNEYINLKSSPFFFWTTKTLGEYLKNIVILSIIIYGLTGLIIESSFTNSEAKINILIYTSSFGNFLLVLICLRLYLGWIYIHERLIKATVSYEESGWYDGQVWIKPPETLIQDTLVANYELLPIIKRLKISLLTLFTIVVFNIVYLNYFE